MVDKLVQQMDYKKTIIERLSAKHCLSKAHTQDCRAAFALNRNAAGYTTELKEATYTLVSDKASGAYLWDLDGNQYIDLTMGFGALLFGHNYPPIREVIEEQLQQSWSVGAISPLAGRLANTIAGLTGVERVAFFNSGTEAVMVAIRLAKAVTGKKYFVYFKGAYHGTFDPLLSLKSNRETSVASQMVAGVTQSILNESFLLEYGTEQSLEFIKKNKDHIAAVLTEPVQSRRPEFQPKQYLHDLRQLTKECGIALIFDEVITGFRIHLGGCQQYFGIKADIITYGKVIGGGMPIGVVAGDSRYLDATDGGFWNFGDESSPLVKQTFVAGTFSHHPLAMASALKTLEILQETNGQLLTRLNEQTTLFCYNLNSYFEERGYGLSLHNFGSLFRFSTPGKANLLYYQLLLDDVYIWEGRNCFLSLSHTSSIISSLENIIKESADILAKEGFIKTESRI